MAITDRIERQCATSKPGEGRCVEQRNSTNPLKTLKEYRP